MIEHEVTTIFASMFCTQHRQLHRQVISRSLLPPSTLFILLLVLGCFYFSSFSAYRKKIATHMMPCAWIYKTKRHNTQIKQFLVAACVCFIGSYCKVLFSCVIFFCFIIKDNCHWFHLRNFIELKMRSFVRKRKMSLKLRKWRFKIYIL